MQEYIESYHKDSDKDQSDLEHRNNGRLAG